jgi:hypothetical protein
MDRRRNDTMLDCQDGFDNPRHTSRPTQMSDITLDAADQTRFINHLSNSCKRFDFYGVTQSRCRAMRLDISNIGRFYSR